MHNIYTEAHVILPWVLIVVNVSHLYMQEKPEPPAYGSEAIRALNMDDWPG
jgi:hypothetical protein